MVSTSDQIKFNSYSRTRLNYRIVSSTIFAISTTSITWLVLSLAGASAGVTSSQQLVVIDADPGIDDAMAIWTTLGDPNFKVLAITCVRGNTGVPNVVINALKILAVAKEYEVPVYTGHNYGLIDTLSTDEYFGKDGFGDLPFVNPPSTAKAQQEHAASYLARIVKEYPGEITILVMGPLTNIALALHLNPDFLLQARKVVILGGSIRGSGNVSPGLEFNMYCDPAAASLVLERALISNTTVTLVPIETCIDNAFSMDWRWNTMAKVKNSVVDFLNKLDKRQEIVHQQTDYIPYDMYAAGVMLSPDYILLSQEYYGFVEHEGKRLRGALALDYINTTQNSANLNLIIKVNTTVIKKKIIQNLSNFT